MRNYVRANETRLTVSFTPQLRAKKRKLNSLTAQSPYISRTGAVRSNDPPFRHFIYSDKFPNFNGKTEPNFLIVSRPIRIDIDDVKYEPETILWRFCRISSTSAFLINSIFPRLLRIYPRNQHFRLELCPIFLLSFVNDRIERREKYRPNSWQLSAYFDGKHFLGVPSRG